MANINLLPWRQIAREERKKEFLISLGVAALFSALMMLPVYLFIAHLLSVQEDRNAYLNTQIISLEQKIKEIKELKHEKEQLLARMSIIQQLQSDRNMVVHIFDDVISILPEGIFLNTLKRENRIFTLTGVSDSNAAISKLMRNADLSAWLAHAHLKQIDTLQKDGVRANNFQVLLQERKSDLEKIKEDDF